jgi:hypothetical protein
VSSIPNVELDISGTGSLTTSISNSGNRPIACSPRWRNLLAFAYRSTSIIPIYLPDRSSRMVSAGSLAYPASFGTPDKLRVETFLRRINGRLGKKPVP